MPLSRHSVGTYEERSSHAFRQGNTRPQSSQLAEPLWTDVELCVRANFHSKKNAQAGTEWSNLPPEFSQARKNPVHL